MSGQISIKYITKAESVLNIVTQNCCSLSEENQAEVRNSTYNQSLNYTTDTNSHKKSLHQHTRPLQNKLQ